MPGSELLEPGIVRGAVVYGIHGSCASGSLEEVMSGDGSRVDWDCDPGYTVGPKSCSFAALREKSSDSGRVDFGEAVYHNYITHFCIQVIHDGSWSSHGKEAG